MKKYAKKSEWNKVHSDVEAPPGFEPGVKALQASALPLGYSAALYLHIQYMIIDKRKDAFSRSVFMERKTRFELATFTLAR